MITHVTDFSMYTTPFKHQLEEYNKTRDREYHGLFWEMGTGKTKVAVDTSAHLFGKQEIDGLLIVSDKGSYMTWVEEIEKHLNSTIIRRVAHFSSSMQKWERKRLEDVMIARDDVLDILLVNVEALSHDYPVGVCERFLRGHWSMMVVDEATSIKNPKAQRTKACYTLGAHAQYRRIMTGTPITNSPMDLFGMCEFLKRGLLGHQSFVSFRSFYAVMMTMSFGSRQFPKIVGYQNIEDLTRRIQVFSSRILKSECLDLPEKLYEVRHVEFTTEQKQRYTELKSTSLLQFDQGLLTSTSALTTLVKLQQICCGHVKLDDGTVVDIPNNRSTELVDLVRQFDEKVVIWCAFQRDVEQIIEKLNDHTIPGYPVHYYGKTTDSQRKFALDKFANDPDCKWFVGTAATGGKGINELIVARYCIYYSNTFSLEDRLQSEDRLHRIGQTRNITYIDFISPGTVDQKTQGALRTKRDLARNVLDNFRELLDDVPF